MSGFLKNLSDNIGVVIIVVIGLMALAGIVRFVILSEMF